MLTADLFAQVTAEVAALIETERSYLPTHKKGGTVAYSVLRENAPSSSNHYRSATMRRLVSRIVGVEVSPHLFMTRVHARFFSMKNPVTTSTGTMTIIFIVAAISPCSFRW